MWPARVVMLLTGCSPDAKRPRTLHLLFLGDSNSAYGWPDGATARAPEYAVLTAFITNGVLNGRTPAPVLACVQACEALLGTLPLYGAPPIFSNHAAAMQAANEAVRAVCEPRHRDIDSEAGFTRDPCRDFLRLNDEGQRERVVDRRRVEAGPGGVR